MAKVYITSLARNTRWAPYSTANYNRILRASKQQSDAQHSIISDPESADIILFVDAHSQFYFDILSSDLYKKYPQRCYIYDSRDNTLPLLPGIYLGIPAAFRHIPLYCYGFYIRVFDNALLDEFIPYDSCTLLFSFVGRVANAQKIRSMVISLSHPRAFLADRSSNQKDNDVEYVTILHKSKFVLCPRGFSPSTWRCFETMKAGRVPVIISDEWMPPPGLPWDEFSVRIPESAIETIPALLESLEDRAEEMGKRARQEWFAHFSIEESFNWIISRCLEIQPFVPAYQSFLKRNRLPEIWRSGILFDFLKDFIRHRFD